MARKLEQSLVANAYPGRGIVIGRSPDGMLSVVDVADAGMHTSQDGHRLGVLEGGEEVVQAFLIGQGAFSFIIARQSRISRAMSWLSASSSSTSAAVDAERVARATDPVRRTQPYYLGAAEPAPPPPGLSDRLHGPTR